MLHQLLLQRHRPATEKMLFSKSLQAFKVTPRISQAFSCLWSSKAGELEKILQEHGLKNILRVRIVLQMYHAQPPNQIGIPFNGSADLLLTQQYVTGTKY